MITADLSDIESGGNSQKYDLGGPSVLQASNMVFRMHKTFLNQDHDVGTLGNG